MRIEIYDLKMKHVGTVEYVELCRLMLFVSFLTWVTGDRAPPCHAEMSEVSEVSEVSCVRAVTSAPSHDETHGLGSVAAHEMRHSQHEMTFLVTCVSCLMKIDDMKKTMNTPFMRWWFMISRNLPHHAFEAHSDYESVR